MRKALHLHMLIQLAGFSHPQDLFGTDVLPNTFKRFFWFVASISFRSTEAFASYTNEDAAKAKLASMPLLPLSKKQRGMIGEARVRESENAQKAARGISQATGFPNFTPQNLHFTSKIHTNEALSGGAWATFATEEIATSTARTGNHVCRPDVCHKGRIGKTGFCRMYYWHWRRSVDEKGRKPLQSELTAWILFRDGTALEIHRCVQVHHSLAHQLWSHKQSLGRRHIP